MVEIGGVEVLSKGAAVHTLMPRLKADLGRLVAIPSISAPGYPEATRPALLAAYEEVVALCRDAGVSILDPLELPGTAPVVMGEIPAPDGAPIGAVVQPLRRRACRRRVEVGSRHRSRRPSGTARSTGAARPTPSRTS
jgi:hypothetical protein